MNNDVTIYFLKWDDCTYTVFISCKASASYRSVTQERFTNILSTYPNAKVVDLKNYFLN